MQKQFFFLSPVEVVKVTSQNLEEVAEWCGGSVQEAESRRVQGRMDKYVLVPTPSEKQISWAFPGMFITKRLVVTVKDELRATYAVFRRDYFEKNYFDTPKDATDKTWERQEIEKNRPKPTKKAKKKAPYADLHLTQNMGEALIKAQERAKALEKQLEEAGIEVPEEAPKQLVEMKLSSEINPELRKSIEETQAALYALGAEVVSVEEPEDFVIEVGSTEVLHPPTLKHEHSYLKTCDSQLCSTDRYADGIHYFSDAIGFAEAEKDTIWTNLEGETIASPTDVAPPPVEELEGKSESQLEVHFSNGVSPNVDVVAAMNRGYQNLAGGR